MAGELGFLSCDPSPGSLSVLPSVEGASATRGLLRGLGPLSPGELVQSGGRRQSLRG